MKLLPKILPQNAQQRLADIQRRLLHREAEIGGDLFGSIPAGHRREFFCLDEHTWVWHEEWLDGSGKRQAVTTRYSVRPNGVLKSQGDNTYQSLSLAEARNLYRAVELYRQRVGREYAGLLQAV